MAANTSAEIVQARRHGGEYSKQTTGLAKPSPRALCSALNGLILAGWSETIALEAAERIVDGAERRAALRAQLRRRVTFRRDLAAAVTALGGVPATHATLRARFASIARRVGELLMGPHAGDAYAACARATERAAGAYARVLTKGLPDDVMFGVESQFAEVEWDSRELRRLRWGASLTPQPNRSLDAPAERRNDGTPRDADDERSIEVWSDEGGAAQAGLELKAAP